MKYLSAFAGVSLLAAAAAANAGEAVALSDGQLDNVTAGLAGVYAGALQALATGTTTASDSKVLGVVDLTGAVYKFPTVSLDVTSTTVAQNVVLGASAASATQATLTTALGH
ncbi:hypothetical protein [Candidatus Methylocalor cossyra]|uniref:Uncharacterized protein n=1 Tax=Candidatus Methylocalor cossyra TaxID=3108543 RepID=A0ABM9NKM2_9GAMM